MLELRDKDMKATIITIVNKIKQNIFSVNENLSREIKAIKLKANGSYRTENY